MLDRLYSPEEVQAMFPDGRRPYTIASLAERRKLLTKLIKLRPSNFAANLRGSRKSVQNPYHKGGSMKYVEHLQAVEKIEKAATKALNSVANNMHLLSSALAVIVRHNLIAEFTAECAKAETRPVPTIPKEEA